MKQTLSFNLVLKSGINEMLEIYDKYVFDNFYLGYVYENVYLIDYD